MRPTTVLLWALLAIGLAAVPVAAQKDKALAHLVKDQQNLLKRLQTFTEKLDRLGKRLDGEGQQHAARLLQRAYAHLLNEKLQETMEQVKRQLESEQLFEAQKTQKLALEQLQQSLIILLDRQDLARLEAELEQMKQALAKIADLRQDQTHLHQETRGAKDPARANEREALKQRLDQLAAEQAKLMQETQGPTADEQAALNRLKIGLEDVRESQIRLADAMQRAEKSGSLERDAVRSAAAKALEAWARELTAAAESKDGELKATAKRSRPAREAARRDAEAALEKLDAAGAGQEAARSDLEKAAGMERSAEAAAEREALPSAQESFRKAAKAAKRAAAQMKRAMGRGDAEAERNKLGKSQDELRDQLKRLADDLAEALVPDEARKQAGRAAAAMEEAARAVRHQGEPTGGEPTNGAQQSPPGGQPKSASSKARQAAAALQQALAAMQAAEAARREATHGDRKALAERESRLAEKTDAAKQAITEQANKEQQQTPPKSAAAERAAEAAHQMRRAAEDLRAGNTARARDRQREAHRRLQKAREALDQRGPSSSDPEQVRKALAEWQRKVREKAQALAKALEQQDAKAKQDGPQAAGGGGRRSPALDRAERSMKRAQRNLERNRMPQAEERQREAIASLNEAEREVRKRERDYIEMAQEEVIFRVAQMIRDVLETQKGLNRRSDVEGRRLQPGKRMPRSVRQAFKRLANTQGKAADVVAKVVTRLEKEKIEVFLFLLKNVQEDMDKLTERLRKSPPDLSRLTKLMQADVERNLQAVLDAFDEEGRRRRKNRGRNQPPPGQKDPQDGQGRPRLIPPTAELIMLKTYEQQVQTRTELIREALAKHDAAAPVPAHIQQLMLRLAHRQGQIREVLKKFMESVGISTEGVD